LTTLTNNNKQQTKNEGKLADGDLNSLKDLVVGREFQTIPPYMEGAGENCPIILLKIDLNGEEKTRRAESCANTPEAFNKVVAAIEKLK
ncbi:MAG: hypothetical protein AABY07_06770, partial [Nanoarchaeota archaeon]